MIKCIIGTVLISSTTGFLIYYTMRNTADSAAVRNENITRDVHTQTETETENLVQTPPNETNLPDFIAVERPVDNTDINVNAIRRTASFASFFKYMRNF